MIDLLYVDEEEGQANKLIRAAAQSDFFDAASVLAIPPERTIEETILAIDDIGCKVLIADFRLSEHAPEVTFTGTELVQAYQKMREGFPCFVTTSFANDAIETAHDANLIFSKAEAFGSTKEDHPPAFFKRVRKKVDEYQAEMAALKTRHKALTEKLEQEAISAEEREELLRVDGQLERALNSDAVNSAAIRKHALEPVSSLITRTETFLKNLEQKFGKENS